MAITFRQLSDLSGRRALITGATGALGRVMAHTLAEMGADLILVDRPESDFTNLERELSESWGIYPRSLICDLEIEDQRSRLIDQVNEDRLGLNILINNAAFVGTSGLSGWIDSFKHQSLETWRRAFEVNLTAAFHLCQAFSPGLSANANGNIINIASIYGEFGPDWSLYDGTPMGNPAAYGASKGGLIQLTRWLATTLGPKVRVNAISPGGVLRGQPELFVTRYIKRTPLARMASEDDFRGAVAYLASDLSSYVTGQILRVDGGWSIW